MRRESLSLREFCRTRRSSRLLLSVGEEKEECTKLISENEVHSGKIREKERDVFSCWPSSLGCFVNEAKMFGFKQ